MKLKIRMTITRLLCLLLFTVLGITTEARACTLQKSEPDTLRLLLIGNSFSWNASQYLPDLAEEAGFPLVLEIAGIGGASMKKHWDLAQLSEKEPQNPDGKPYNGKSLKEILSKGKWDIVSIHQVSIQSGDPGTYRPYASKLFGLIKKIQPEAQVVIHETWPYRIDSNDWTQIPGGRRAVSNKEMWENLRIAYHTIASELGIEVVPVGDAFWKVNSSKKWGYKEDKSFDRNQAVFPELPNQENSLHMGYFWKDNVVLRFDTHHANEAGCFLGSLVWYTYLFDKSPKKLDFSPKNVPDGFARYLKKVAWSVAKNK